MNTDREKIIHELAMAVSNNCRGSPQYYNAIGFYRAAFDGIESRLKAKISLTPPGTATPTE